VLAYGGRARALLFLGPAVLVSVGYLDPGNWATDLEGGARFGYQLLWLLLLSNLLAMLLQNLCARLGLVTGLDLAQACRAAYPRPVVYGLWLLCEFAIIACDLAEVVGSAVALNLLFSIPLAWGALITALDVFLLLLLQRHGLRRLEAIVAVLVLTVGACLVVEVWLVRPVWSEVAGGFRPRLDQASLYVAIGILGATVMPHNLYLHSALVKTRRVGPSIGALRAALRTSFMNTFLALNLAFLINAAILIVAAGAFFSNGLGIADIRDAHGMLAPLLGTALAPALFAIALLCAGQSATVTGTLAGQVVMEGFLNLRMRPFARSMLTRSLAVGPAIAILVFAGEKSAMALLVATQVVLSLQLPFAIVPLLRFTSGRGLMGPFASSVAMRLTGWSGAALVISANSWLVLQTGLQLSGLYFFLAMAGALLCTALLVYIALVPLNGPAPGGPFPAHANSPIPAIQHG
jgi:manganese transport protein